MESVGYSLVSLEALFIKLKKLIRFKTRKEVEHEHKIKYAFSIFFLHFITQGIKHVSTLYIHSILSKVFLGLDVILVYTVDPIICFDMLSSVIISRRFIQFCLVSVCFICTDYFQVFVISSFLTRSSLMQHSSVQKYLISTVCILLCLGL
jgi:hypothetical protein